MNFDEIMKMSDDDIYALSLQKTKKGYYSRDADFAYAERQRRSGYIYMDNVNKRCGKYQADLDYYGAPIE